MEAVVKSLDPNSTASRDAVLDTATEIIRHVVKTYVLPLALPFSLLPTTHELINPFDSFPTVDFHHPTQCLAVGTAERAFIMYDLKTATQLYVVERHTHRPTTCAFSLGQSRLMTVSLKEGVVRVWKVGPSTGSTLLHPTGRSPRQGEIGSWPYKTFPFNVGEEGAHDVYPAVDELLLNLLFTSFFSLITNMMVARTLEWVRFEWLSYRGLRLHMREGTLCAIVCATKFECGCMVQEMFMTL